MNFWTGLGLISLSATRMKQNLKSQSKIKESKNQSSAICYIYICQFVPADKAGRTEPTEYFFIHKMIV